MLNSNFDPKKIYPLSVVIPTLGGESINKTIEKLNDGTVIPKEILICIPDEFSHRVANLSAPNIKIVKSKLKGQVVQRALGFKQADNIYVMQLDDDCLVDQSTLEVLLKKITASTEEIAISPILNDLITNKSIYFRNKSKIYELALSLILEGKRQIKPGSITKSGINYGVDFTNASEKDVQVDWLPGGCILMKKDFLVTENFYPFKGKAYCEDLIHSFFLKKNGLKLILTSEASCRTEFSQNKLKINDLFNEIYKDYRARKYFLKLIGRTNFRVHVVFIATLFIKSIKSIQLNIKN